MPTPPSLTEMIAWSPSTLALTWMLSLLGVYLAALLSRLTNTCVRRTRSPSSCADSGGNVTKPDGRATSRKARLDSTRSSDNVDQAEFFFSQLEFVAGYARNVQQIIDQSRQMIDLLVNHIVTQLHFRLEIGMETQDLHRAANRMERIAQLVGKGRQKIVLLAIGFAQLPEQLPIFLLAFIEPQQGLDSCQELGAFHGLSEIGVRAALQAQHTIWSGDMRRRDL